MVGVAFIRGQEVGGLKVIPTNHGPHAPGPPPTTHHPCLPWPPSMHLCCKHHPTVEGKTDTPLFIWVWLGSSIWARVSFAHVYERTREASLHPLVSLMVSVPGSELEGVDTKSGISPRRHWARHKCEACRHCQAPMVMEAAYLRPRLPCMKLTLFSEQRATHLRTVTRVQDSGLSAQASPIWSHTQELTGSRKTQA